MKTPPIKHGFYARSPTALELQRRKVRRLVTNLYEMAPWLKPSDQMVAQRYCRMLMKAAMLDADIDQRGAFNMKGETRRVVDDSRKMDLAVLAYARELGLTPVSRQALEAASKGAVADVIGVMVDGGEQVAEAEVDTEHARVVEGFKPAAGQGAPQDGAGGEADGGAEPDSKRAAGKT